MKSYGICPVCGTRLEVEDYFTEEENYMTKGQLLSIMIQYNVLDTGYPISIKQIAQREKVTYYLVHKYMLMLRDEGLVRKTKIFVSKDERPYGWVITDKCKELEEFKEAKKYKEKILGRRYVLKKRRRFKNYEYSGDGEEL